MIQKHEPNLLNFFLNKICMVEVEKDLEIKGKLLRYQLGNEKPHRPYVLILELPLGKLLIRGNWIAIKVK